MSFIESWATAMRQLQETKIRAKTRATLFGHPEWENACTRCGCELNIFDGDTCKTCSIVRYFTQYLPLTSPPEKSKQGPINP